MFTRRSAFALAAFPVLLSGCSGDSASSTSSEINLIPADAVSAVILHPHRVLTGPQGNTYPQQLLAEAGKELGFEIRDVDELLLVFGRPDLQRPDGRSSPNAGAMLRFANPVDLNTVAKKFAPNGVESTADGKKMLVDKNKRISCVFLDDRTLLVSDEDSVPWLMSPKTDEGPVRRLVAAAGDTADFQAFVDFDRLRPTIAPQLAQAQQQLPPALQPAATIPNLIATLSATAKHTDEGNLQYQLTAVAPNSQSAGELDDSLKQLLGFMKAQFPNASATMSPDSKRLADAVAGIQPARVGNQVEIKGEVSSAPAMGIVTALLVPAVQAAREAVRRNQSANNLKEIGLAILNYEDKNHHLPPRAVFDKQGKPLLSWRVLILPLLEENELYGQFHLGEQWDSPHNKPLVEKMPAVFKHPLLDQPGMTLYQAVVGKGCAFEGQEGTKLASFTDGHANTIMALEVAPTKAVPWTKPDDWEMDERNIYKNLQGIFAGDIFNVLYGDCHVEGIVKSGVSPSTFKAMLTRNGHESIPAR